MNAHVCVDEQDDHTTGHIGSPIPGKGRSVRSVLQRHNLISVASRQLGGSIRTRIVDYDQLPPIGGQIARSERRERCGQIMLTIVHRDDYRELGFPGKVWSFYPHRNLELSDANLRHGYGSGAVPPPVDP